MDAGPDALRTHEPPLGAVPVGHADIGLISPELALVDPELSRRARELLPDPRERPRRPLPVAAEPRAQPEMRRRRRWPRALALAIVIFVTGAASGTFLGNHDTSSPPASEVRGAAPSPRPAAGTRAALRPPRALSTKKAATKKAATRKAAFTRPQRRRHAQVAWASNVLGVTASVNRRHVALLWQPPADSARVVVLRKREGESSSVVVYRGRATSYRDSSLRPCTGYRYTIVNYDRRGHLSTGVPTSVVTRCA